MNGRLERALVGFDAEDRVVCLLDAARTSLGASASGTATTTIGLVVDDALLIRPHTVAGVVARLLRIAESGGRLDVHSQLLDARGTACLSVNVTFTTYAGGAPARAEVMLELVNPPRDESATRTGGAQRGTHQMLPGEDLPAVAHAVYGDATRWRAIAEASGLDDPLAVAPGTIVTLPPHEG